MEEFAIVERVARIVSSVRGTKPDYTRLAAELEQAIPFEIFGVVLLRHDRQAVRVTVCCREHHDPGRETREEKLVSSLSETPFMKHGEEWHWKAFYHQHPLTGSMLESLLHTPQLIAREYPAGLDGLPAESGDALSGYPQLRSTLIVPLMVEERVLGTLELGSVARHIYTDKTLQRLVEAVARVLASAIESAQLGGSAEIQNRQRQALKDVSSSLTSKVDLSTILEQIVNGINQALNVSSAIVTLDPRSGKWHLEAQVGVDGNILKRILENASSGNEGCILAHTVRHRMPFTTSDIATDERFPLSRILCEELGIHSIYCHPLITGTTVYGVLCICSTEPGGFTPLKVDILSLFASQATIALHNGMLLKSVQQRSRFQEAIEQLERAERTKGEVPLSHEYELLARVREETQRTFGVNLSSILAFISQHLLTQDEQNLQAVLQSETSPLGLDLHRDEAVLTTTVSLDSNGALATEKIPIKEQKGLLNDTLALLTRTAETALVRAGMLGELGELLMQLRQSVNGVKDAWFVVDLHGTCLYMNTAAEVLSGIRMQDIEVGNVLSSEQALGHTLLYERNRGTSITVDNVFSGLLPRIRNAEEVSRYLQDFMQGHNYRQEVRCVLAVEPVGTSASVESIASDYHYQLTRYPLHNQQEQLVGNALQMSDVTEQVRDEKNRSALLSSVSHELRTPLTTIKMAVTGLLQPGVSWDEQELRAMLQDIDTETDHLTVLVNGLVEMSRIEMGALTLEKAWCDIAEIAYGAIAKAARILAGRPVRTYFQQHLPLMHVDHVQLERVFYNLIENAVRYSPEGEEIIVTLDSLRQGDSESSPLFVRARIIDHGSCVPAYERERIFSSFYNLRSYDTSLSLAICKGIVEAHQGRIWVESLSSLSAQKESSAASVARDSMLENGRRAINEEEIQGESCFVFTLPAYPPTGNGAIGNPNGILEKNSNNDGIQPGNGEIIRHLVSDGKASSNPPEEQE